MEAINFIDASNWVGILSTIFLIMCFYFTLTFFQYLKQYDERMVKQAKLAAVICLAFGLLLPILYGLYMFSQVMQ